MAAESRRAVADHGNRVRYIFFPQPSLLRRRCMHGGVRRDIVTHLPVSHPRNRAPVPPSRVGRIRPTWLVLTTSRVGHPPLGVRCVLLLTLRSSGNRPSKQAMSRLGSSTTYFQSWMYCTFDSLVFFSRYAPSIQMRLSARE